MSMSIRQLIGMMTQDFKVVTALIADKETAEALLYHFQLARKYAESRYRILDRRIKLGRDVCGRDQRIIAALARNPESKECKELIREIKDGPTA